jgi:hypothetical protein
VGDPACACQQSALHELCFRKGSGPADKTGLEALLSKDYLLLQQIGIFFHGEEWQAPLSRDLHVNERTMRRWVAGTEDIPRGVWRDLSVRLEIYNRTLGSLAAQVKHTAGLTPARSPVVGGSTLSITRIALPKEKLQKLTSGERSLFLLLGYASNQINTLWKLVVVATNESGRDPVEEKVSAAQTQIFVRLLIGIMREALKLIEKRFLGSPLGMEYAPRLSAPATEALKRLKKRFGAPDKFVVIRDNFAFHHPSLDDMEAAFQLAAKSDGDDTDWCMYLNNALLNTFFFASDFVLVHGMANAMGEPDVSEAHRKLLGDIAPIANDLSTFVFGFAEAIFIKYFGELTAARVAEIKGAANIEDLRLPWFVETTNAMPS